jgi:hypothetical protein
VALDDQYANKFAPLDSTTIYPKPGHKLLYSPMTGEMKCPIGYTFALRIPFHLLRCWCNTCTNLDRQMIWSTSYHHVILLVYRSWPHLLFTVAFVHRCQVLLKLHRHAVHRSKASTCPSRLQPVHQTKYCLDLLRLSHMTPCHVSYAMRSFITCVSLATNPSHLHRHGMSCSHKCTCRLITCISHIWIH